MILRRLIKHFRHQDWTVIAIEFVILVAGVFIGIQVSNWNDDRATRQREELQIERLMSEFLEIEEALVELEDSLARYISATRSLIVMVNDKREVDDDIVRDWLADTGNLGRPVSQSATYLQLVASGDLAIITDEELRNSLVIFDQAVQRNAFLYPATLNVILEQVPITEFVHWDYSGQSGADFSKDAIVSFDRELLSTSEPSLEVLFVMQRNLRRAVTEQLESSRNVIAVIEKAGQ